MKPILEAESLLLAGGGEGEVGVTGVATGAGPIRFAVADEVNLGQFGSAHDRCKSSGVRSRPECPP